MAKYQFAVIGDLSVEKSIEALVKQVNAFKLAECCAAERAELGKDYQFVAGVEKIKSDEVAGYFDGSTFIFKPDLSRVWLPDEIQQIADNKPVLFFRVRI